MRWRGVLAVVLVLLAARGGAGGAGLELHFGMIVALSLAALLGGAGGGASRCNITGTWRGHPSAGRVTAPILVVQESGGRFTAKIPGSTRYRRRDAGLQHR